MFEFLKEHCEEIGLVKGNHDRILGPLARKRKLKVVDSVTLRKGKIMVLHGHELPKDDKKLKKVETFIIAHEHPVIGLKEEARMDNFKAFLKGDWRDKELIVMPSLLQVTKGIDVTREKRLSPFLQRNISYFECWLHEAGNVYWFKRVSNLYS
jgi:putative SbcD/Mre11-related phosphoesterase